MYSKWHIGSTGKCKDSPIPDQGPPHSTNLTLTSVSECIQPTYRPYPCFPTLLSTYFIRTSPAHLCLLLPYDCLVAEHVGHLRRTGGVLR